MILEEASLDEETIQKTVQLMEKLSKLLGNIFMQNRALHALEFDELIETELKEIKRKVNEIMKITFDRYREI